MQFYCSKLKLVKKDSLSAFGKWKGCLAERVKSIPPFLQLHARKAAKSLPQSMKLRNEESFPIFRIASVMQTTKRQKHKLLFFLLAHLLTKSVVLPP